MINETNNAIQIDKLLILKECEGSKEKHLISNYIHNKTNHATPLFGKITIIDINGQG